MRMRLLGFLAAIVIATGACSSAASPSPATGPSTAPSVAQSAAASGSASPATTPVPSPTAVELDLDFDASAVVAPLYYGIDQGIFRNQGIDLTINATSGSSAALLQIDSKKIDFAMIDMSSIMADRIANKTDLVGVMTWQDYPTFSIVAMNPINSLNDLVGKTFGTVAFSSGRQNFPQVLQANGIDPSKVTVKLLDYSVLYQTLFSGGIYSAETGLPGSGDNLKVSAQKLGKTVYMYPFSQWGFVDYSKVITTRNDVIQSHPDLVQRMVTAINESMKQGLANLTDDQVVQIMKAVDPQSDPAASTTTWGDFKSLTKTYGAFDAGSVEKIFDRTVSQNKLSTTLLATDFYTNDYIKAAGG